MHLKTVLTIFTIGIFFISEVLTSDCYNCRQNTCTHEYCNLVEQTIESSGLNGLSLEEWNKIPNCPKQSSDLVNNPMYNITCQTGQVCGKLDLNFTTTSVMSITPGGNNSIGSIPILASGKEVYESTISVLGCLSQEYKCPEQELSKTFNVPNAGNPEKTNTVLVGSESLSCCNCDGNLCNTMDAKLNCNQVAHQPGSEVNSAIGKRSNLLPIWSLSIVILFKVL